MSRHGLVSLDWADGTYDFRLGLEEMEEVEEKLGRSIFEIVSALHAHRRTAKSSEIREVLRCGLIGGGMKPADALVKVRRYLDERPLDENRDIAYAVALAGLARVRKDDLESAPGEGGAAETSASTSPRSEATPS